MPLTEYTFNDENPVDRIFYGRINIKKAASFLFFAEIGIVKNLIHSLKYRGHEELGALLGHWYGNILSENGYLNNIDYVLPVPLHPKKMRKRGYNQVSLFAQTLATYLNCSYLEGNLIKTANTRTQTKRNRWKRWAENRSLYEVRSTKELRHKNVLLVDDVITTGATMELCARALISSVPGIRIYLTSMAVVP